MFGVKKKCNKYRKDFKTISARRYNFYKYIVYIDMLYNIIERNDNNNNYNVRVKSKKFHNDVLRFDVLICACK